MRAWIQGMTVWMQAGAGGNDSTGLRNCPPPADAKFLLALFVIGLAVTLAAFSAVLSLPFAGDDFDHLRDIGDIRSGRLSSVGGLFSPFNEQTMPIMRLLYMGATCLSGLEGAITLRIMLVLAHAAGAVFCGLIVQRYTGSRAASVVAIVAFAGAAGFSGSVISAPACGIFLLGLVFVTAAVQLLTASVVHTWNGFVWSMAAFLVAGFGMNGAAVFAVTLAILCLWSGNESRKERWLTASLAGVIGVAILLASRWNYSLHVAVPPLIEGSASCSGVK